MREQRTIYTCDICLHITKGLNAPTGQEGRWLHLENEIDVCPYCRQLLSRAVDAGLAMAFVPGLGGEGGLCPENG